MITKRQYLIFNFLHENLGIYKSSKELSTHFQVSVRTIKNELQTLKRYCTQFHSFELITSPGKGSCIRITNAELFKDEIQQVKRAATKIQTTNSKSRVLALMKILLDANSYISKYSLMETFFISESTLYHSLNEMKLILKKYNLSLVHKTNLGYRIVGKELNKRMCIAKSEINDDTMDPYSLGSDVYNVYNTIADVFFKYKYQINEQALQNITTHILLTMKRVRAGHIIHETIELDLSICIEYKIAEEILHKFISIYNLHASYFDNEVRLLTQTILGKIEYSHNDELQKEINTFISEAFVLIRNKYYVNFEPIENLKLFFALHLVPLFYRIKSGTQLINMMTTEIRQTFPLAHDIAIYFSILIEEKFHLTVSQDEISYLSLYFNYGLENYQLGNSAKRVLILTSLRKSETVLLRHKILTWFPNQIAEIVIEEPSVDIEYENFDAVFSTDKNLDMYQGSITHIRVFPEEKDFEKINLAINGYTDCNAILDKFCAECYYYGKVHSKDEILDIVCNNAIQTYSLSSDFTAIIKEREKITSTYFGNGIAIPHPLSPFSNETFVSVGILEKPICWDATHMVQIVMLVSIEKNNPRAFQFWYYISTMVRDEQLCQALFLKPSYERFIELMRTSLKNEF